MDCVDHAATVVWKLRSSESARSAIVTMALTMDDIKAYFDPKLKTVNGKLALLISVNPDAALRSIDPPLVGQGTTRERKRQ